jgi:hypothetical protein
MMAELSKTSAQWVIRCQKNSDQVARAMFKGRGLDSQMVTWSVPPDQALRQSGLPTSITVRFVRVLLETGEYEVLMTSLLDEKCDPTEDFKEIDWYRWGIETFFGPLKNRLGLENFSGLTAEAVKQDVFSTLFVSGLETILTGDAHEKLQQEVVKNPKQVNKAVSFHAIKHQALAILMADEGDIDTILEQLTQLFLKNPTVKRTMRKPPRKSHSSRKSLHFHKRKKKVCY